MWLARRRQRRARQAAVHEQLRDEYEAGLEAEDPATLEASRDWADNDGVPWNVAVWGSLGLLSLFVVVPLLIVFFLVIKSLTGG